MTLPETLTLAVYLPERGVCSVTARLSTSLALAAPMEVTLTGEPSGRVTASLSVRESFAAWDVAVDAVNRLCERVAALPEAPEVVPENGPTYPWPGCPRCAEGFELACLRHLAVAAGVAHAAMTGLRDVGLYLFCLARGGRDVTHELLVAREVARVREESEDAAYKARRLADEAAHLRHCPPTFDPDLPGAP